MPMAIMYFDSRCQPYAYLSITYDGQLPDSPKLMEDQRSENWPVGPRPGEHFTGQQMPKMNPMPITGSGYAFLTSARGPSGDAATPRQAHTTRADGNPGAMAAPQTDTGGSHRPPRTQGGPTRNGTNSGIGAGPQTRQKPQDGPRSGQGGDGLPVHLQKA